jgi:septal ring factor EnvC (AmiA/AmiB activator)
MEYDAPHPERHFKLAHVMAEVFQGGVPMKAVVKPSSLVALALASALLSLGAASPDQAEKVAQKMLDFDKALTEASTQIDKTLGSMNALSSASGSDLTAKYKTFTGDIKKLDSMSQKAKAQSQKATAQREQYLKQWQANQAAIQNEQLKAASEARRNELLPKIEAIKTSLGAARETFGPLMQALKDLNLYLGNNLTPQGISGAGELMQKVNTDGASVKDNIAKGQEAIKDLAASISPGGTAAK